MNHDHLQRQRKWHARLTDGRESWQQFETESRAAPDWLRREWK
jgi:hypothetical protein